VAVDQPEKDHFLDGKLKIAKLSDGGSVDEANNKVKVHW